VRLVGCWLLRVEVELVMVCGVFRLIVRKLLRVCLGDVRRDPMHVRATSVERGRAVFGLFVVRDQNAAINCCSSFFLWFAIGLRFPALFFFLYIHTHIHILYCSTFEQSPQLASRLFIEDI